MLDVAYFCTLKEEDKIKEHKDMPMGLFRMNEDSATIGTSTGSQSALQSRLRKNAQWLISTEAHPLPPEPHQTVFWACTWGINMARLVWQFLTTLKWPPEATSPDRTDVGISWVELAISFMLWSGQTLPVKIRIDKGWRAYPLDDPKVQMQPPAQRSLRNLAESFRWVVKHIHTFSQTKFIPTYKKQGSRSLVALGFSTDHEGGLACRPELPNGDLTYKYIQDLLLTMPGDPPYHANIPILPLQNYTQMKKWPNWSEADPDKQQKIQIRIRNALRTKKSFDTFSHPDTTDLQICCRFCFETLPESLA